VPWSRKVRYKNAATGDHDWLPSEPGTSEYEALWRAFLTDFVRHLGSGVPDSPTSRWTIP
jgi:hypothetical protein